jgi:fatty acid desaturase
MLADRECDLNQPTTYREIEGEVRRLVDDSFVQALKIDNIPRATSMTILLWAQLVCAWFLALLGSPWMTVVAFVIICACQQAMVLWVHEASHYGLMSSRRGNDLWADLLLATPIGMNVATYRAAHFTHHRSMSLQEDRDRWTYDFNIRGWRLTWVIIQMLVGYYGLRVAWRKYGRELLRGRDGTNERIGLDRMTMAVGWNVGLLALCFSAGRWYLYFVLWAYPIVAVTVLLNILRSITEHQPVGYGAQAGPSLAEARVVRSTQPPFWEKWLLYQTNFNYHLEHHVFPFVPWYNLPKLHRHLTGRGFYDRYPNLLQKSCVSRLMALSRR